MKKRAITLMSLASALAAIAPAAEASITGTASPLNAAPMPGVDKSIAQPNTFYTLGENLMGLVATTLPDGTVLAQHYSHSSHSSHSSHYSSR